LTLFRQTGFLQKRFSPETPENRSRAVSLERAFLEIRFPFTMRQDFAEYYVRNKVSEGSGRQG
jgi:hypothetical protein